MKCKLNNMGIISVQALWIVMIISFLLIGLTTRTLLQIKITSRTIWQVKSDIMATSVSEIIESILNNDPNIIFDQLNAFTIVIGRDTFAFTVTPGILSDESQAIISYDEESKININTAPEFVLQAIFSDYAVVNDILEVRKTLLSYNNYYADEQKIDSNEGLSSFDIVDDLVSQGIITSEQLSRFRPFITTFGSGRVNINTASENVMKYLGFPGTLISKIITVRQTADRFIKKPFSSYETLTAELINHGYTISPNEANIIRDMTNYKLLDVKSEYYSYSLKCNNILNKSITRISAIYHVKDSLHVEDIFFNIGN